MAHATHDEKLARTLGYASIAIGLTEIAAPKQLENIMGLNNGQTTGIFRALGLREIMHGVDILSHNDPAPGVWARVAGDMLDGALLAVAATKTRKPAGFAAVTAAVLGVVAMDFIFAAKLGKGRRWD